MKNNHSLFVYSCVLACTTFAIPLYSQCVSEVTHLSGSKMIGCVNVQVTPSGAASTFTTSCPLSLPTDYWIGCFSAPACSVGSYTFTFTPPISALSLSFGDIDNSQFATEEVSLEVNGAFYFVPAPGGSNGCAPIADISPTGTIVGCTGCILGSGWADQVIDGPISSLKVTNTLLTGEASGTIFSLFICPLCCATNAGVLTAAPLKICPNVIASVPPATLTYLETNDIVQYVLFSDPGDTLGSIIAISNTPQFSFNPATMLTGVPYYIAAVAGNNVNGSVDLNDHCVDFSNAIQVIWRAFPTVTFTVVDDAVCQGACKTVTVNFTGTPPFILKYQSGSSGIITQNFPTTSGTIQVCPPSGTPPGPFEIQAVSVKDAFCTCE